MYIEAAKAYGASNWRIIFRYLIPRIIPLLIPGLVQAVPAFFSLEASLAVIGLATPSSQPGARSFRMHRQTARYTKVITTGYWNRLVLVITGLAFAFLGFVLDRIFNPRLRDI